MIFHEKRVLIVKKVYQNMAIRQKENKKIGNVQGVVHNYNL
jgi:hypothetical protein